MALWKICVLRANDDPRWQTIHSFWVRMFSFQIQFIRSPEMLYSILILRENWIVDARMEKMLFESSFYGRDYGQNLCFFFKKKKRNAYLPTQISNLKKWEPRNFFIMALVDVIFSVIITASELVSIGLELYLLDVFFWFETESCSII